MKTYRLKLEYQLEAESKEAAEEIVAAMKQPRQFANGSIELRQSYLVEKEVPPGS